MWHNSRYSILILQYHCANRVVSQCQHCLRYLTLSGFIFQGNRVLLYMNRTSLKCLKNHDQLAAINTDQLDLCWKGDNLRTWGITNLPLALLFRIFFVHNPLFLSTTLVLSALLRCFLTLSMRCLQELLLYFLSVLFSLYFSLQKGRIHETLRYTRMRLIIQFTHNYGSLIDYEKMSRPQKFRQLSYLATETDPTNFIHTVKDHLH